MTALFGIELPIVQAPMAGAMGSDMVIAVSEAGGLGSLPCGMLSPEQMREEITRIRARTSKPINLNFLCHSLPADDPDREAAWRRTLAPYSLELGLDPQTQSRAALRQPFDEEACIVVEEFRPEVVSFHFGLPSPELLARVRATGAKVVSSATTVEEARWLEVQGCDAIVAQGIEAGGHRATFLHHGIANQVGTMALVPQVVDSVKVPVIAAGGIADTRGIAAAFALGAAAVQIGTAYLFCPEAKISTAYRTALLRAQDDSTVLTNLFSGGAARGIVNRLVRELGPMSLDAPPYPLASAALAPLRAAAERAGSPDFSPLWAGQAVHLSPRDLGAAELTRMLARYTGA